MREWHFNVLFVLACIGALTLLFSDKLGLNVRPEVTTIFGLLMAFILQQKRNEKERKLDEEKAREEDELNG